VVDDLFGATQEKPAVAAVEPGYCYGTIGKVNCYTQPLGARKQIGYEGPRHVPPQALALSAPDDPVSPTWLVSCVDTSQSRSF
jgi:hypothetical protein